MKRNGSSPIKARHVAIAVALGVAGLVAFFAVLFTGLRSGGVLAPDHGIVRAQTPGVLEIAAAEQATYTVFVEYDTGIPQIGFSSHYSNHDPEQQRERQQLRIGEIDAEAVALEVGTTVELVPHEYRTYSVNERAAYSLYQLEVSAPGTYRIQYNIPDEHPLSDAVLTARVGSEGRLVLTILLSIGVLLGAIAGAVLVLVLPLFRPRHTPRDTDI